jgi:hypothetical protein
MNNVYANYFCQKFFTFLEFTERINFLNQIKPCCVFIATSKVGTYPLQAIIESLITNDEKIIILEAISENILDLCYVN